MGRMGLQARGTAGVDSASTGGTWDISNADRLGKSEIDLVNIFIEGVAQIIRWEQALERGENIDAEVAKASLPKFIPIAITHEGLPQHLAAVPAKTIKTQTTVVHHIPFEAVHGFNPDN